MSSSQLHAERFLSVRTSSGSSWKRDERGEAGEGGRPDAGDEVEVGLGVLEADDSELLLDLSGAQAEG